MCAALVSGEEESITMEEWWRWWWVTVSEVVSFERTVRNDATIEGGERG